MRVASSFVVIAFSSVIQSLANGQVTRFDNDNYFGVGMTTYESDNFCGPSSFEHETASEYPLLEDCQELFDWFNDGRKTGWQFLGWNKDHLDSKYLRLGNKNSCSFAAKPLDANDGPPVITWGDIADIIRDSMAKFSTTNQLRVSGVMDCQVPPDAYNHRALSWEGKWEKRKFQWQLYKVGTVPELQW